MTWQTESGIEVQEYDVAVVRQWLRGMLDGAGGEHEILVGFLAAALADESGDLALSIAWGRHLEKKMGHEPAQLRAVVAEGSDS